MTKDEAINQLREVSEKLIATVEVLEKSKARNLELSSELERLRQFENGMLDIINESKGVIGWHLNGDVADWSEFDFIAEAQARGE